MQIYGILLNIRGKSWKICGKSFHFFPFHSSNSSQMTRFRGRFRSFLRSFLEKIREFLLKNGEYRGNHSVFIPFLSTSLHFIPFYSSNPRFSSPNVKSY